MTDYVATLRLMYKAQDEVEAQMIAELARERAESELETEEDGDEVILTQVTSFASMVEPRELLTLLAKTRNELIKTRWKKAFDLAAELDQVADALQKRLAPDDTHDYDFGKFMEIATQVLQHGENPSE